MRRLFTGVAGGGLAAASLTIAPETVDVALAILGGILLWISGADRPAPPAPTSARSMAERGGVLLVLGVLAGCAHPPGPPVHVSTTVLVEGADVDAATRWRVCATARACAFIDVGLLWSEDGRVVCIELPEYGLLTCHEVQ